MKTVFDFMCSRCGNTFSVTGIDDVELIRQLARAHVCPDGRRRSSGEPTKRIVLGPGERLSDDEGGR